MGVMFGWHVIGSPGILVLGSSQAFGCPPLPPSLPLTALDFAYSLVQCKEGCDLLSLVI